MIVHDDYIILNSIVYLLKFDLCSKHASYLYDDVIWDVTWMAVECRGTERSSNAELTVHNSSALYVFLCEVLNYLRKRYRYVNVVKIPCKLGCVNF